MGTTRVRGRRRQMARRLRTLRTQAGMSLDEVSKKMEWSSSKLGRWESGEHLTEIHGLKSLLDIYGVTADRWEEYFELSRAARQHGWWHSYGLDNKGYVPLEADASLVKDFTLCYVPGLLQTADYARALFRSSGDRRSAERLKRDVTVRTIRQKRLTSEADPLELIAIMDESALYRPIGGPEVMAAQLARLIEVTALDTVTLQVLPMSVGAHPSMAGVFTILSFGDLGEPDVWFVEHTMGSTQSEKADGVAAATLKFDRLRSDALGPDDSVALIRKAAERY